MRKHASIKGVPANLLGGAGNAIYPEIYFRMQPEIEAACDRWAQQGIRKPTQAQLDTTVTEVQNRCTKRWPELARAAQEYEKSTSAGQTLTMEGLTIQQRGGWNGLIAFLLLAELFRRRGRQWY